MFEEKHFEQIENGLIKISTNSFFNFGFPKIIANGKNTQPIVILKGVKKNNLVCLVAFRDARAENRTIAKKNADPIDTVYLLLIEAASFVGVVKPDWYFCPLLCLKSKYFENSLTVI